MSARADNIVSHFNFQTEKLRETSCNGLHRKLGIYLSFRSAEMRAKDNLGSVLYKILNCGKRSYYSLVACYNAVFHFNVKVATNENSLTFDIEIFDCHFV